MPSGTSFGAQYEVYFDQPVDFFNDILPVWTATRRQMAHRNIKLFVPAPISKLVVIPYSELDKRFTEQPGGRTYLEEVHANNNYLPTKDNDRLASIDYMALSYSNGVKLILQIPGLNIQPPTRHTQIMVTHPRFSEIQQLESQLTGLTLTDNEKELVAAVISHPNLAGKIAYHGIQLVSEDW
jgi:hypothetical protein